jgi:predicted nucleotidyltransferase component of viral defense system
MLTSPQIKSLATKLQTTEYNIATEYCQHLFLSHLYKLENSEKMLFKGGTSLRVIFESPRFSEDLDFTGINLSSKNIENLILESLNNVSYAGIEVNLEGAKKTSGGYLSKIHFSWLEYSPSIQIEISLRGKSAEKEVFVISSEYLPPYSLFALKTDLLVKEKIDAAVSRKKPRDFFDIYFLLRSRLITPDQKELLKKVKKTLENADFDFSGELKQFLPVSMHPVIKNFRETFNSELRRNLP